MAQESQKPVVGFTCGDINGIGIELIIKSLTDNRINELCLPVIFASNKCVNFYRKVFPDINFSYQAIKDFSKINLKQINVYNCWDEEVHITPGQLTEVGGKYALISLQQSVHALKAGHIQALVTAPIHKNNIQSAAFNYSGHTPYLKAIFDVPEVVMLMTAPNMLVFGPYSADAFFARGHHEQFNAVLAMYHDQGLIPFKSLGFGEGVNYTAGLPVVRTSPDHGTAFDIAGKGKADYSSFLEAIFVAVDIIKRRADYEEMRKNPLRKMSNIIVANAQDEVIKEDAEDKLM